MPKSADTQEEKWALCALPALMFPPDSAKQPSPHTREVSVHVGRAPHIGAVTTWHHLLPHQTSPGRSKAEPWGDADADLLEMLAPQRPPFGKKAGLVTKASEMRLA